MNSCAPAASVLPPSESAIAPAISRFRNRCFMSYLPVIFSPERGRHVTLPPTIQRTCRIFHRYASMDTRTAAASGAWAQRADPAKILPDQLHATREMPGLGPVASTQSLEQDGRQIPLGKGRYDDNKGLALVFRPCPDNGRCLQGRT